ncbi:MAG: dUTP diphosphatase [Spirochaetia bacterium]|nr:dUTP diphosphatase [Spirochaetia bacterium]
MALLTVKYLKSDQKIAVPEKQTHGSGACDIKAHLKEPLTISAGQRAAVSTGISVEIPAGYILSVRPRSGLAINHGITMINSPGTIDSDFRGEIKILLINLGSQPYTIQNGERIAQLILEKSIEFEWLESDQLNQTKRGENGFGSTGR